VPEQLYQLVRRAILSVSHAPGAPLSEAEVALANGVSRTPVREAFRRLEAEGLIAVVPNVGTFVARIDLAEAAEAVVLRALIEPDAARRAADAVDHAATGRALERIAAEQAVALRRNDPAAVYACDERFHETLFRAIGFLRAWHCVRLARDLLERVHHVMVADPRRPNDAPAQHAAIAAAIRRGAPDQAAAAMAAHIAGTSRFLDEPALRRHPWVHAGERHP
jgi:DNA-binding GntR family transcriptional regulator